MEVSPHPPYSPDTAPSDYYLFRSLNNFLRGNDEATKTAIDTFLNSEPTEFFKPWQEVIEKRESYIDD
ncbi:Histone-lysine N-methyltransferase SETMAR [Habropoda laboriosa]|uniref:Histone-lysine N-methyltransferase SETMAR n=1 Tax=Habropoda laboriosa TaxID=597456 RepID=A0A0L7QYW3_9HYME|nr:Histone-lysine N-methyltransferase SETMAR [Habropoda laboriosa]